jgi:hypothetical protein
MGLLGQGEPGWTIDGLGCGKPGLFEVILDEVDDVFFIIDDQNGCRRVLLIPGGFETG